LPLKIFYALIIIIFFQFFVLPDYFYIDDIGEEHFCE